jgi:hypothetical protein
MKTKIDAEEFLQEVLQPQILLRARPMDDFDAGITEGLRVAGALLRRFAGIELKDAAFDSTGRA